MPHFDASLPQYILKHHIEREAQAFRCYLGLDADAPVDAVQIAEWLGIDVRYPGDLRYLSHEAHDALIGEHRSQWSGITYHLPGGIIVAVLNPQHSQSRQQATLMEEVAHVHLGHAPSALKIEPQTGSMTRTYDKRCEQEAYWFGSAVLVPKSGLRQLYGLGYTPAAAAAHFGVSDALVTFRTNLCGLGKLAG